MTNTIHTIAEWLILVLPILCVWRYRAWGILVGALAFWALCTFEAILAWRLDPSDQPDGLIRFLGGIYGAMYCTMAWLIITGIRSVQGVRRLYVIVTLGAVAGLFWTTWWWNDPSRRLFFWATDVHEWSSRASITGDGSRVFRARCSEDVFQRFAQAEGLTRIIQTQEEAEKSAWSTCRESWWNPPEDIMGAYYSREDSGQGRLLKFSDGYLYYDLNWW